MATCRTSWSWRVSSVVGAAVSLASWWNDHPELPRTMMVNVAMEVLWVGLERARSGERTPAEPRGGSHARGPGAFYNCVSAALSGVPRSVPRRRLPVPGGVGRPPGRRRLLPGDVPVGHACIPRLRRNSNLRAWVLTIAHRKALDNHRANGAADRCRWQTRPNRARRPRRRPILMPSSGQRYGSCPASSGPRWCCALPATCRMTRSERYSGAPRTRPGATSTKDSRS